MDPSEGTTGTRDEHFDLVSLLYHALRGADACGRYASDAEAAGDERLAAFFGEAQATQRRLAGRAKGMLGIGGGAVADTAAPGDVPPRSADVQRQPDVSAEEVDTKTETNAEGAPPMLDALPTTVARPDEDLLAETRGAPSAGTERTPGGASDRGAEPSLAPAGMGSTGVSARMEEGPPPSSTVVPPPVAPSGAAEGSPGTAEAAPSPEGGSAEVAPEAGRGEGK